MDSVRQIDRYLTANRRLRNILRSHVVANDRLLEQKISDAGPTPQRIDPHILTSARNGLVKAGHIVKVMRDNVPWYHLASTDPASVQARLDTLHALHQRSTVPSLSKRIGQALEIAVFRALVSQTALHFFGSFRDLDAHDDNTLYTKDEPPSSISGRTINPKNIDFLVHTSDAIYAAIEVKNVRPWIYPARQCAFRSA